MTTLNNGMSLRQVAKVLGVSHSFLSQVRNGKRPMPDGLKERLETLGAYHLLTTLSPESGNSSTNQGCGGASQAKSREFESHRPLHSS